MSPKLQLARNQLRAINVFNLGAPNTLQPVPSYGCCAFPAKLHS